MTSRVAVIVLSAVVLSLAGAIAFIFAFGTPQAPGGQTVAAPVAGAPLPATDPAAAPAGATPETPVSDAAEAPDTAATDAAPAGGPPLAIEIPGCVCHSDDPKQVAAHAKYRINECAGCHSGGMPAMGGSR